MPWMRTGAVCAGVLCLALGAPVARCDEPKPGAVKLDQKFEPGMTTYYRMIMENDNRSMLGGKELVLKDRTAMLCRNEVYSVRDDGSARVAMTYVRVKTRRTDGRGVHEFDSSQPTSADAPDEPQVYRGLIGKTMIIEMTPDGRTLHVQGWQELIKGLTSGLAGGSTGTSDAMQSIMQQGPKGLMPEGEFGGARTVGEEWTKKKSMSLLGSQMENATTYRLDSVDVVGGRRIAHVSMRSTMSSKPNAKDGKDDKDSLSRFMPEMSSDGKGLMLFDLDRGRLVRYELRSKTSSHTNATTVGGTSMPGTDSTGETTMIVELVGPEDPVDPEAAPVTR